MTKRTVKTEKELGQALKDEVDTIEIEGNLATKTFRIHATGNIAWAVAFAAIGIAVYSVLSVPATGGLSTPAAITAGFVSGGAVATILGSAATTTAISIAVAAGSASALTALRNYKKISYSPGKLVLQRKK